MHWPEYISEAVGTAFLVLSICVGHIVLWLPASPAAQWLADMPLLQRLLMGAWMAVTVIILVYCHLGKRSGAHYNPAVTLTFFRLGKVRVVDAIFYVFFQFIGAVAGIGILNLVLPDGLMAREVNYVVTQPGNSGVGVAMAGEMIIAFVTMMVILLATNFPKTARLTGLFVAMLLVVYLTLESPFSGSSMNPARSFGSALIGNVWNGLWIYFVAPTLGMLAAAEIILYFRGSHAIRCAKLNHTSDVHCIFKCGYACTEAGRNDAHGPE